MDIKEIEWEDVGWIDLSHDRNNVRGHSNDCMDWIMGRKFVD
jgi:hypothetical protein